MITSKIAYVAGDSPVHHLDARAKILVLLAFSLGIFFIRTGVGLAVCAAVIILAVIVARIPASLFLQLGIPVYVLAAFSFAFNVIAVPGWVGISAGAFFAARMILLVMASFVVCLTTTADELLDAFTHLIGPLRAIRVPVDDIALTLALSIRFIPVIQEEFLQIRTAQRARGAEATGSVSRKLSIWGSAFASLFIGLFRHADALGRAMDARCYGAAAKRTHLPKR